MQNKFNKSLIIMVPAIEWYDNAVCVALMGMLSPLFFPMYMPYTQFLLYLSIISIAYIGRPLGALLYGYYGDKFSGSQKQRLKSIYASLLLMAISSFLIALLPMYSQVGILSPILFLILRFLQAIALGGKGGISVVSAESGGLKEKYYNSSFVSVGFVIGFLSGTLTVSLLNQLQLYGFFSKTDLATYIWRLPFIFSAIISLPVLFKLRKLISEIEEPIINEKENTNLNNLNIPSIAKLSFLLFFETASFYFCFIFLPNYLKFFSIDLNHKWYNYIIGMLAILVFTPIFGKLADKYGAIKNLKIAKIFFATIGLTLFYYPNIIFEYNLLINIMFGMCVAVTYGSMYGYLATIYPVNMRFKIYALQVNIVGMLCSFVTVAAGIIANYGMHYNFLMLATFTIFSYILLCFCKEETN